MSEKQVTFKYGKTTVDFQIPSDNLLGDLKMAKLPAIANPKEAILQALRAPIDSPALKDILQPNQTVAIIVNDTTRVANTSVFMPILLDEINQAGIPDKNISLIFALGTHRAMTNEEMLSEVGKEAFERLEKYNPDCKDNSQFTEIGHTSYGTPVRFFKKALEADHIICTGSVVHHFFAGFGGGRKAIFPGISHYETVRKNHSLMLEPGVAIGKLHGNPIYEDQMQGVKMHPPSFLLNVVLNEKKEFLGIFAGNYITAHLKACEMVDEAYGVQIDKEADLVIATCGGYPKDINVYQLQKTMDNAHCAVREGGVVILFGECIEGSGSTTYEQLMDRCHSPKAVEDDIRADFQIGAHKAYSVTRLMNKAKFILVSSLSPELAEKLLFTPARDFEHAMQLAKTIVGDNPTIHLMPQGSLTVPRLKK